MGLGGCLIPLIYGKTVIPDSDPGSKKTMLLNNRFAAGYFICSAFNPNVSLDTGVRRYDNPDIEMSFETASKTRPFGPVLNWFVPTRFLGYDFQDCTHVILLNSLSSKMSPICIKIAAGFWCHPSAYQLPLPAAYQTPRAGIRLAIACC